MVLDTTKFIANAVRKQAAIAHLDDCKFIALKTTELPANIKKKIFTQYDEDYLNDANLILFAKGPIDKKKIKKLFNCVDKALGGSSNDDENANLLTDKDFKLLKMDADDLSTADAEDDDATDDDHDADAGDSSDSDETPDSEVDDIVNDDSDSDADDDDANSDPIKDTLEKKLSESRCRRQLSEEGMSIDDILKVGNAHAAKVNAELDKAKAEKTKQTIRSIWIKDIDVDDDEAIAELQITYSDGAIENTEFEVSTAGKKSFADVQLKSGGYHTSSDRWTQVDADYAKTMSNLKRAFAKYGVEPNDEDMTVAQVRSGFNDPRITWYYGKMKKTDPLCAFSRTEADLDPTQRKLRIQYGLEQPRRSTNPHKNDVRIYKNGRQSIYARGDSGLSQSDLNNCAKLYEDESSTDDPEPSIPTKWVFLKITLKK